MHVTSFSSISYCSNSEYWPQKHVQNGKIHSKMLDVYVEWQSAQNFLFFLVLCKLDKNIKLSPNLTWKLVRNQFCTGTNELHGLHTVMIQILSFNTPIWILLSMEMQRRSPSFFLSAATCWRQGYFGPWTHYFTQIAFIFEQQIWQFLLSIALT